MLVTRRGESKPEPGDGQRAMARLKAQEHARENDRRHDIRGAIDHGRGGFGHF
jgi:hypothetical protein